MNPTLAHKALYDAETGDFLAWESDETANPIKTTAEMEVEALKASIEALLAERKIEAWPAMKAMQEKLETQRSIVKALRKQLADRRDQNNSLRDARHSQLAAEAKATKLERAVYSLTKTVEELRAKLELAEPLAPNADRSSK